MNAQHVALLSLCTLFAGNISSMDQKKKDPQALPDQNPIATQLHIDYTNYLHDRMAEYKKKTDIDLEELYNMGKTMTGISGNTRIFNIKDEHGNYFVHVATQKRDLKNITYLYDRRANLGDWAENNDKKTPFDICIEQLAPIEPDNAIQSKAISLAILHATMRHMEMLTKGGSWSTYRKNCVQKIINLELAYQQYPRDFIFTVDQELLISLFSQVSFGGQPLSLTTFYQEAISEHIGNTFTHLFVHDADPDGLFEWACGGKISFLKNKAGKNPLDCALERFQHFTHNVAHMESDPEGCHNARCCLFILLNYCTLQNKSVGLLRFCCDKHTFSQ